MDFEEILAAHMERYPLMQPRDYGKLAYQSEFGAEHLLSDESAVAQRLLEEWKDVPAGAEHRPPEEIGNGLCRFYLNDTDDKTIAAEVLEKLFILTAKERCGSREGLEKKLSQLEKLPVPGMLGWLEEYRMQGCPPVRHSEEYRKAYGPRYRLLKKEYARFFSALLETAKILRNRERAVIAIDGRCGSGKTTLSALMEQVFDCRVFHMDDFYLPWPRRAENWMTVPGGNMDLERFRTEILIPAFAGQTVCYRRFDCSVGQMGEGSMIPAKPLTVIEGSYSHHPALNADYDLKIFLTCEKQEQRRRLKIREGDYFPTFESVWMPLEEQYIRMCNIESSGAMICDTATLGGKRHDSHF